MNDPSLRVFGRRGDPETVALVMARSVSGSDVHRHGKTYRVSLGGSRTLFRQVPPRLVMEVDAGPFSDANADRSRTEVRDDVVRWIRGPGLEDVLDLIPELRIAVSFLLTGPGRLPPSDPVFGLALDVASRTDGFVLDLYNGRLLSMTGQLLGSTALLLADGGTPVDPSVTRISGRLVALVAIAARALTEYDGRDLHEARGGITGWIRSVGLSAELEGFEEDILQRQAGGMDEAELAHGTWQIEGAGVLAWALELIDELPAYDEAVDPTLVSGLLCFPDAEKTRTVLRSSARRFQAVVDAEAERHFAIYWRLQQFVAGHRTLDLESSGRGSGPGSLRFDDVPLLGGDLAIGGIPIADADPAVVDLASSITAERLRAFNWLQRGGLYSATDLGQ